MSVKEKELDFLWRLNDFINTLNLFAWSNVGPLLSDESISLLAMPGGEETVYMDGVRDKVYPIQINAKSRNQLKCVESLSHIAGTLENLAEGTVISSNETFDLESIEITSMPNIIAEEEHGFFVYGISLNAKITIYN